MFSALHSNHVLFSSLLEITKVTDISPGTSSFGLADSGSDNKQSLVTMEVCCSDVQDKSFHEVGDFDDNQEEIQNLYVSINLDFKNIHSWGVYNLDNFF